MSLFADEEVLASVYHTTDSNSTKISTLDAGVAFAIMIFPIRRNEDAISIAGAEYGDYVVNVNADYSNAGSFRQGDTIIADSVTYYVINRPRYNNLFNRYKLVLRRKG
jgi:hypothetical protein